MRRDSVVPRGRKAVAALALVFVVAAMVAVLTPTPAEAQQSRCGLEFWYYSDATYTELVGIRGWWPWACGCGTYGGGEITPYREIFDKYC